MAVVSLTGQVSLVIVLLVSGVGKLTPSGFAAAVDMFRQLAVRRGGRVLAALLVGSEIVVALLVALPVTVPFGAVAAVVLFAVLTGGVAVVLGRRMEVRCACFGARTARLRPIHLVRNAMMLTAASGTFLAIRVADSVPSSVDVTVLAILLGALLALILIRFEDIATTFSLGPARS